MRKAIGVPVTQETIDATSGDVIESKTTRAMMMPAPEGTCELCAVAHAPEEPHNAQSLFYQYAFYAQNEGRWPDWNDAMAHCSPEVQAKWKTALEEHGVDVDGGKLEPGA